MAGFQVIIYGRFWVITEDSFLGTLLSSAGLITAGGTLHVSCEILAYQALRLGVVGAASSAIRELTGLTAVCSQHSWCVSFRA